MYRNFYSYNDMPRPIREETREITSSPSACDVKHCEDNRENTKLPFNIMENGKILGRFELDDVILIVIILLLLADDCDDTLLLLAIGFVFISGII